MVDALQGGTVDTREHVMPGSIYVYVDQALDPREQGPTFKTNVTRFSSRRSMPIRSYGFTYTIIGMDWPGGVKFSTGTPPSEGT
jgi:hypothetical protein